MRIAIGLLTSLLAAAAYAQDVLPSLNEQQVGGGNPSAQITTQQVSRARQLFLTTHTGAVAVFDLTGQANAKNVTNANSVLFFPFPSPDVLGYVGALKPSMCPDDASKIIDKLTNAHSASSDRWISAKGDTVDIYLIFQKGGDANTVPSVNIKEDDRDTELAKDLNALGKIVKALINVEFAPSCAESIGMIQQSYHLTKVRSTLTLTVSVKANDTTSTVEKVIITGPTEHLFLSADVPITKLNELKYDATNKTFTTKDTPTICYVGFDYGLGDVVTTDQQSRWEAIVLKLLVKISRNPLDSYGAAIGYRSPNFSLLGMTLQSFTPFVGYFRTKVNDKDQSGNPIVRRKSGVRAGISLNIDRAVDWIKKK